MSLDNLAQLYTDMGAYGKAEPLMQRARRSTKRRSARRIATRP